MAKRVTFPSALSAVVGGGDLLRASIERSRKALAEIRFVYSL